MKRMALLLVAALVARPGFAQTPEAPVVPLVYKDAAGRTLPYRQYVTPGLPPGAKVPLVVFFHGAGERGADNAAQLAHGVKPIIRYCQSRNKPLALIAPQCPAGKMWVDTPWELLAHRMRPEPSATMRLAMGLLDERLKTLPVDTNRVYVTGLSMGGFATWDLLQRRPGLFAAGLPVCGGGDTTLAWKLRDIPVWAFHGSADPTVPVERSRSMVAALWACGGKVRYREYPGLGHFVWGPTYDDPEVLDWLFSQRKK